MTINKFTLMLEGSPYEIERRGELIVVNGIEFAHAIKDGQIFIAGTPHPVKLDSNQAEVDGIAYTIEAKGLEEPKASPRGRKAASASAAEAAGAILAIMPGLIIKILKKEGDRVEAGETVIVLEAMKMQNELQAKVSGTIQQMNVKEGENVEMRQVLCIIE